MKTTILAFLLAISCQSSAEHYLNIGLFTEHYKNDRSDYNEDNRLIQWMGKSSDNYTLTAATFTNSHYARSYLVGAGYEYNDSVGVFIAAVEGYDGYLKTHYEGLIFVPIFYAKTYGFTHAVMGPVYSLGYSLEF